MASTFAQEELTVANHEVTTGVGTGEIVLKTRIASGFDTFQQSQVAINKWGGTDGCERLAVCMMLEYQSAKALMAVEVRCPRHASRQIKQLGVFVIMIFKQGICHDANAVCAGHHFVAGDAHCGQGKGSAATNIHKSQCFNIFKSSC